MQLAGRAENPVRQTQKTPQPAMDAGFFVLIQ